MDIGLGFLSIDEKRLKEVLCYDAETGEWRWRSPPGRKMKAGDLAGTTVEGGYIGIRYDGRRYLAHRLAWVFMTGQQPPAFIDHKDRNPTNCRWDNLRAATQTQNNGNSCRPRHNRSGIKGVSWAPHTNGWVARIKRNGKLKHLGVFCTSNEAQAAYAAAAREHFGEFARTE